MSQLAVLIFVIAWAVTGPWAQADQKNMEIQPNSLQFGKDILLKDQSDFRFAGTSYANLAPAIRSQVDNYLAFYLTAEAQPSLDPQFTTRTFTATAESQNDLVEYRWTFSGVPLRAVQSWNAVKIEIPLSGHGNVDDVKALVAAIVKLKGTDIEGHDYEVNLHWPSALADGTQFSSNPGASILSLSSWHDRIDAFVDGNRLNILIYKKIPQLAGYQDGSKWFQKYPPAKTSQK
jgi:hypothetical protein